MCHLSHPFVTLITFIGHIHSLHSSHSSHMSTSLQRHTAAHVQVYVAENPWLCNCIFGLFFICCLYFYMRMIWHDISTWQWHTIKWRMAVLTDSAAGVARPPVPRPAVGMGIPMGIPMGMGMVWVWGLWWIPMGSVGNLWGFLNGCNFCGIERNSTNSEFVFFITFIFSCIIVAKYLYSQVIPLCAKRRPKTMILSL